ncbi:MAG: hypothetical protein HY680_03525, partial [Chloroflexi bacterium]|nr:hypothetical protein [Chloroflexota bacterium]
SLGSSTTSPQQAGATVTFTASASPSSANPEYQWWLGKPDGSWSQAQDWGSGSYSWNTTGLSVGNYRIVVYARASGSTAPYQAYTYRDFTLQSNTVSSVSFGSNQTSSQVVGTTFAFTASASPGYLTVQYKWWLGKPNGAWSWGFTVRKRGPI